ncbi:MAG: methionyl-tRNA formyltransferase [Verrucomicrobiota bacterium]
MTDPAPAVPLRVVFMGTPDLAATVLRGLAGSPHWTVLAAVSQPDKPAGRDLRLQPTPVKREAQRHGIPILQPARARDPGFLAQLRELQPDLIAVAAYGQILPAALLSIPRHGCLNVHTSILPRYRGAAPIQWALAHGDAETGVTIMQMDAGMDTGPIVSVARTPILEADTGQSLHDRLAEIGGRLLVETIPGYVSGALAPRPQPVEGVVMARKLTKEDGRLDWTQAAPVLRNRIRAFNPWPGAYAVLPGDPPRRLKIHEARVVAGHGQPGTVLPATAGGLTVACGAGALELLVVQPEGSRRMSATEFLAGHRVSALV